MAGAADGDEEAEREPEVDDDAEMAGAADSDEKAEREPEVEHPHWTLDAKTHLIVFNGKWPHGVEEFDGGKVQRNLVSP